MSNHLFLLKELVQRDFQSRYAGSLLGFLWPFLQPLWQLLLFSFVFSTVLKLPLTGERTESFALFLFCGLLPWMAINEGVTRSTTAITDNANLVKNVSFRPEILLASIVVSALVQEGVAMVVFLVILAALGKLSVGGLPLLAVAVPLQIALTLGLGLLLCCIHTLFRDTAQLLALGMMGWFYLTPIVYPRSLIPAEYQGWIQWNPLTTLVDLYRRALLAVDGLPLATDAGPFQGVGQLAVATLVVLGAGVWLFRRLRPSFADEV